MKLQRINFLCKMKNCPRKILWMPQRLRPFPAVSAIFVIHQIMLYLFLISKEIKSKSIFLHFYQDCLGNETSEPEKSTPIAVGSVRKK